MITRFVTLDALAEQEGTDRNRPVPSRITDVGVRWHGCAKVGYVRRQQAVNS
jgi:hypothetical protein